MWTRFQHTPDEDYDLDYDTDYETERRGPSSLAIGLMIGIPLAALCIAMIATGAKGHYQNGGAAKPMTEPVYDRPAYTANSKAPSDINFLDKEIEYATGNGTTVVTPQVTRPSENDEGRTANGGYFAADFTGVLVDKAPSTPRPQQPSTPVRDDDGDQDDDRGSGVRDDNKNEGDDDKHPSSGNNQAANTTDSGGAFVEREGNDISDQIWKDDKVTTYNSFTQLDVVADTGGRLGSVSIPSINLNVGIYKSDIDEMEAMNNGVAHFNLTSSWDGNVGLCAHNWTESGNGAFFRDLNKVKKGDTITYTTSLGTRTYKVSSIDTIDESDWSYLSRTDDNRLTLITCTFNDSSKRLCVQAVAV